MSKQHRRMIFARNQIEVSDTVDGEGMWLASQSFIQCNETAHYSV